jgi:hypothetical protein
MSGESAIGSEEGYRKSLALLHDCATPDGFVASPRNHDNYRRIWSRDGVIITLAALLVGDGELIRASRQTFETLVAHQGPHGEIPTNVDTASGRVSYGGTTGRVDSDLWFIIGCGEYWLATGDDEFLEHMLPAIEKVRFLLGAWEINNRGLIYVPLTGDWADEYVHNGYVLYDQLLYLQAQRTLARMHTAMHGSSDHALAERISRLLHLIRDNYWFDDGDQLLPDDVYHEVLYEKGRAAAAAHGAGQYWMPFFTPGGYGYRFDAFANVLASLLDVANDARRNRVDAYITGELVNIGLPLLPAFHPVIKPVDEDWEHLHTMFSYSFKNKPYEYHNGGLWPMITGFYVADLARRQRIGEAGKYLQAIHRGNAMEMEGEAWGFPEYIHGRKLSPGGNRHQGWSAAAAVIGHHALEGQSIFRVNDADT